MNSQIESAPALTIPEPLQSYFLIFAIAIAAAMLAWAGYIALRQRSPVPLLLVLGGFTATLMEPAVTYLGHVVHPEPGQVVLFKTIDRAIPWHIALLYMTGFGLFYLAIYNRLVRGTLDRGFIWKTVVITAICCFFGEAYPVSQGLWVYYGYHPLRLWDATAPVTWNWLNACCMLTSLTIMLLALPRLKGAARLLLLALAPAGAFMGHMGAGYPMYNAMNSALPVWALELSGVASVALVLVVVWLCSILLLQLQAQGELRVTAADASPLGTPLRTSLS